MDAFNFEVRADIGNLWLSRILLAHLVRYHGSAVNFGVRDEPRIGPSREPKDMAHLIPMLAL